MPHLASGLLVFPPDGNSGFLHRHSDDAEKVAGHDCGRGRSKILGTFTLKDPFNPLAPRFQRLPFLCVIAVPVVDRRDA